MNLQSLNYGCVLSECLVLQYPDWPVRKPLFVRGVQQAAARDSHTVFLLLLAKISILGINAFHDQQSKQLLAGT
jgi:hypothetical protein